MIGKVFNNRYKIIDKLGSGGTAIVYRGQDLLLNRMVTIKILREEYASNQDFVRRFRHEAQAVASLAHNNIVGVYDVGFEENMHYIVMEFVEGESLKDYLRRKGVIPVAEACKIIAQILAGVQHAHEHGIIHRDIKSQNILMSTDGKAKVTDFGIAVGMSDVTLTYNTSSRIMGSVHYISPEQVQGQNVTEKSDIYSVGVVFYELLTGRLPFLGETPISIAMQHVQGELILPHQINDDVSMGVSYVVVRAMRKNADTRYESAKAMADAVRTAYEGEMNGAPVVVPLNEEDGFDLVDNGAAEDKKKKKFIWTRKKVIIASAAGVALILLLLLIAWATGLIGGEKMAEVPDLVGTDLEEAEATLEELGLVAEIVYQPSEEEEGTVIDQDVMAGQQVSVGRTVELTVSDGEATIVMPDLVGSTQKIAELTLSNKGISFKVTEEYDDQIPENEIILTSPAAGTEMPISTEVEIVVSLGAEPKNISMPNLLGKTMVEANSLIQANNFIITSTTYEESTEYPQGQIMEQSIAPGVSTQTGASLTLTISEGPGPPEEKTDTVSWTVTNDGAQHMIFIEMTDDTGTTEIYSQLHDPGDAINVDITYYGSATVTVSEDGIVMDSMVFN